METSVHNTYNIVGTRYMSFSFIVRIDLGIYVLCFAIHVEESVIFFLLKRNFYLTLRPAAGLVNVHN